MAEFSKADFGHPNHLEAFSGMPKKDPPAIELKSSIRNLSHGQSLPLSVIEASVIGGPGAPFPWGKLKLDANLVWETVKGRPRLRSTGLGPALAVKWKVRAAGGWVLGSGTEPIHHHNEAPLYPLSRSREALRSFEQDPRFRGKDLDGGPLGISVDEDGRLSFPLYLKESEVEGKPGSFQSPDPAAVCGNLGDPAPP